MCGIAGIFDTQSKREIDQPLFNEDGSVVVVFNGEIYNFVELMPELQALGHTFRTYCDTEVIVHAWAQWGEQCVTCFRGMFAFVLWDRNKQTLFMARDRRDVKPLYYGIAQDGMQRFIADMLPVIEASLDRVMEIPAHGR